jgi:hypothetical protein
MRLWVAGRLKFQASFDIISTVLHGSYRQVTGDCEGASVA